MAVDLDSMSKDELEKLRRDAERKLKDFDQRRRDEARAAAERAAKEHGFTLEELLGVAKSRSRSKSVPRYRHPENASTTWTGRGRKPGWVLSHLEQGGKLEDLAI